MNLKKKTSLRQKRVWRIRKKVQGTADRPRLCATFSNRNIYVQAIDDEAGKTLVGLGTVAGETGELSSNSESARKLAAAFVEKAKEAGITRVVFDRHGRPYHGRVKAFAEAAREAGLEF